jgi:uncharacterized damage-inducible protein DinB
MAIADVLLPEFDHEMATTRKLLARVPEAQADWRPHPRSQSFGEIALHIAGIPRYATAVLTQADMDVNPPGAASAARPAFESTAGVLEQFDGHVAQARAAIAATSDEQMVIPWALKNGGHTIISLPRAAMLRTLALSHMIHHRGQLSVYLRLQDIPVPSIYGPSADEPVG